MDAEPQRPKDWDCALLALDGAIQVFDLAEKGSDIPPAIEGHVGMLVATIRVFLLLFSDDLLQVYI